MARGSKILVVLPEGSGRAPAVWKTRPGRARFSVVRPATLGDETSGVDRIEAVLFHVDARGRAPAPLRDLKRISGGAPLLPFRLESRSDNRQEHRRASRKRRAGVLPIPPRVDLRLLEAVLAREIQLAGLRRRGRDAAQGVREATERLRALSAIVKLTGSELDPHRIIDVTMEKVEDLVRPSGWLFLLADQEQGLLAVERTGGDGLGAMKGKRLGIAEGVAGRAAQRRQPIILEDTGSEMPGWPKSAAVRSALAVPLLSRGRLVGVLLAVHNLRAGYFTSKDASLMSLLLEPAAVAIDNALLLKKSEELSVTDDLTKLYNSRYLNATLRREVERSKRYRTPVSLIFLDLDGFKNVNDQHGHLWGSRTLVEIGRVISATVREIDVVSRFGGDEFTVILPQTGPEGASIIADRIRQKIAETTFLASYGMDVRITASLGIASFPDHGRSKDDLLARADQAMYLVKGRGKNGVALAEMEQPRPMPVRTVR